MSMLFRVGSSVDIVTVVPVVLVFYCCCIGVRVCVGVGDGESYELHRYSNIRMCAQVCRNARSSQQVCIDNRSCLHRSFTR